MSLVKLNYGMTLNVGNYSNFKPELELTIDTDKDVQEQINAGVEAIRAIHPALEDEMARILETEGLSGYESVLVKNAQALKKLTERVKILEKSWTSGNSE